MQFKPLKREKKQKRGWEEGARKYAYRTGYHLVITREGTLGRVSIMVDPRKEEGEIGQKEKEERGGLAAQYHIICTL